MAPSRDVPPAAHGTITGYNYWKCRCERCTEKNREYHQARRKTAGTLPMPASAHGTDNGYKYYKCRCDECRFAYARSQKFYRDNGGTR